jgi:tetratricopeptide (TPR) repeat protein
MQDRLEALLQFLEDDPRDAFTRFALAREYQKRGDFGRALEFFEGLVRDNPDYVGTYYHLGKLYEQEGREEEAKERYRQGIAAARRLRDVHAESELRDALLQVEGIGFDD